MNLLIKIVVNALAVYVANAVLEGIHIRGDGTDLVLNYLLIGAIFGLVNTFIKPVVKLFALPLIILTLGLFTIVINAAMLELVAWLSDGERLGSSIDFLNLSIDDFWWDAIFGAIIISLVSMALNLILPDDD